MLAAAGLPETRRSGEVFGSFALPPFVDAPALSPGAVVRLADTAARGALGLHALQLGDVARVVSVAPGGGAVRLRRLEVDRALAWWYRPAALQRPHPASAVALAELDLVRLAPGFSQITDAVRPVRLAAVDSSGSRDARSPFALDETRSSGCAMR